MLKGLNPGRMDILVFIESETETKNAIGEKEKTWTAYKQAFASRDWKGGSENFEAKQEVGTDSIDLIIRFDSSITSLMRFKMGQETTYFYIRGVQHWQREGYSKVSGIRRDNQ